MHSFYAAPADESVVATVTSHGTPFVSSIATDHLFACQFHPEKSQAIGLRILENFGRFAENGADGLTHGRFPGTGRSTLSSDMLIIPAIDIKDGRCVRLYQGDMDRETVYYEQPVDAARHLVEEGRADDPRRGPQRCGGGPSGPPAGGWPPSAPNPAWRWRWAAGCGPWKRWKRPWPRGVERVVIGTKAYEDQDFLRTACERFPGRVVVGIDARDGKVAVRGWRADTATDAVELARRCEEDGAARIIYTDISRDGTGSGVNAEQTAQVARAVGIPVIASGGVGSLDDIRTLARLSGEGIEGVIVGRALYNGAFSLGEAMAVAEGDDAR